MKRFVFINIGVSGSGKSSRLNQMFLFFRHKGLTFEDIKFEGKNVGILIKEINTLFLGKIYTKKGITRFQGLDAVNSIFGTSEGISKFIAESLINYNVFIEGAGVTDSFRFRPAYFFDNHKDLVKKIFFLAYLYPHNEEGMKTYSDRLVERSGNNKVGGMWNKNRQYTNTIPVIVDFIKNTKTEEFCVELFSMMYSEPISKTGEIIIDAFNPSLKDEFISWSSENDYTKVNRFENWVDDKKPENENKEEFENFDLF